MLGATGTVMVILGFVAGTGWGLGTSLKRFCSSFVAGTSGGICATVCAMV